MKKHILFAIVWMAVDGDCIPNIEIKKIPLEEVSEKDLIAFQKKELVIDAHEIVHELLLKYPSIFSIKLFIGTYEKFDFESINGDDVIEILPSACLSAYYPILIGDIVKKNDSKNMIGPITEHNMHILGVEEAIVLWANGKKTSRTMAFDSSNQICMNPYK